MEEHLVRPGGLVVLIPNLWLFISSSLKMGSLGCTWGGMNLVTGLAASISLGGNYGGVLSKNAVG